MSFFSTECPLSEYCDLDYIMQDIRTREASDIILVDNNFAAIVKAVSWSRNMWKSVSKVLQFQLTVKLVTVTFTLVSAVIIGASPLTAPQLLWVIVVMDILASLALATENPSPELLKQQPHNRNESIVSRRMWVFILGHSLYQLAVLLTLVFAGHELLNIDAGRFRDLHATPSSHFTVVFNTFVLMQIFNMINARKVVHRDGSAFNIVFLIIVVGELIAQVAIVELGDTVFATTHLTADLWLWCIFLGSTELLIGQLVRLIPIESLPLPWKQTEEAECENVDTRVFCVRSPTRMRTQVSTTHPLSLALGVLGLDMQ